jgi:hypothetical protein
MFEAAFSPNAVQMAPQGALRALDWAEVVARLTASRDLRAVFARPPVHGGGFVPQAATGIAGPVAGERSINLAALATGKCADDTIAAAVRPTGRGDRDKR